MAGVKRVDQAFTSPYTKITSSVFLGLADDSGLGILGWFDSSIGNPVTTAGIFAPGCILINKNGSSTTTNIFVNTGTTASPTFALLTLT